ncbi:MAG: glycosyltransferase, partial [Clostridiales Family XIII bacterium]|nr:glycosyltransferase [Clostridiales Family XIII bacterium]
MAQLSVVIPVYNVARYIGATLDSVLAQTFADIEVVAVDDGSSDGSKEILADYAARDGRVVPIFLGENGGSAHARKRGAEAASGAYILFVDGDDTLAPDACGIIARRLSRGAVDLLQFPENVVAEGDVGVDELRAVQAFVTPHRGKIRSGRLLSECIARDKVSWTLHGKVFAAEPMKRACAEMSDARIVMGDDLYMFFLFLYFANSYRGVGGKGLYTYYLGRGITGGSKPDGARFEKYCGQGDVVRLIRQFLERNGALDRCADAYARARELLLANCVRSWIALDRKDRARGFDALVGAWGAVDAVSGLADLLREEKKAVADGAFGAKSLESAKRDVRTIATFYYRLRNGGTERIISALTELWLGMGFKVVLFTEEPPHAEDYPVAPSVTRVVLPRGQVPGAFGARAERLRAALAEHGVDLMVYHAWVNPFALWDMLLVKSSGVPFVMYAHSIAQFMLLFGDGYYHEMPSVYRLADAVLSLSRVDRQYWGYFCDCVKWISNPVCFDPDAIGQSSPDG